MSGPQLDRFVRCCKILAARRRALNKQLPIYRRMHLPVPLDGELAKRCQNGRYIQLYHVSTNWLQKHHVSTDILVIQEFILSNAKYIKGTDQGF